MCRGELTPAERAYVAVPNATIASRHLKVLTAKPHVAGTPGDAEMAQFVQAEFRAAGLDAEIYALDVKLNYPSARPKVALIDGATNGTLWEAALAEDVLAFDATSDTPYRNHTFHGYARVGPRARERRVRQLRHARRL